MTKTLNPLFPLRPEAALCELPALSLRFGFPRLFENALGGGKYELWPPLNEMAEDGALADVGVGGMKLGGAGNEERSSSFDSGLDPRSTPLFMNWVAVAVGDTAAAIPGRRQGPQGDGGTRLEWTRLASECKPI